MVSLDRMGLLPPVTSSSELTLEALLKAMAEVRMSWRNRPHRSLYPTS